MLIQTADTSDDYQKNESYFWWKYCYYPDFQCLILNFLSIFFHNKQKQISLIIPLSMELNWLNFVLTLINTVEVEHKK